jgi:hypothetical protein
MTITQQLTLCKTGTCGIISQLLFVGVYATQGRYNVRVSELKHYYDLNHLHHLSTGIPQSGIARACLTPSVLGSNGLRLSVSCGGN